MRTRHGKRDVIAAPDRRQKAKDISEGQRGKETGHSAKSTGLTDLWEFGSIQTLRTLLEVSVFLKTPV